MLRCLVLPVLLACAPCARGEQLAPEGDPMLSALARGGAARAAVCAGAGGAGCAGALVAPHWLLARASCLPRHLYRAPVLLHRGPEDCRAFRDGKLHMEALSVRARFVHPAYSPAGSDEAALGAAPAAAGGGWEPLDAALLLLAGPAPVPPNNTFSATYDALLPQLRSWVRYVPGTVGAPRPPAPLASPLRALVGAVVAPMCALLAAFFALLRVPERRREDRETLLPAPDALTPQLDRHDSRAAV